MITHLEPDIPECEVKWALGNITTKKKKRKDTHLNVEFRKIARRDKKSFSDQCKEIEKNNRMGKTRHLFKKMRDTKGNFHAKDGHNKEKW